MGRIVSRARAICTAFADESAHRDVLQART
jgi:hypothetical protein